MKIPFKLTLAQITTCSYQQENDRFKSRLVLGTNLIPTQVYIYLPYTRPVSARAQITTNIYNQYKSKNSYSVRRR